VGRTLSQLIAAANAGEPLTPEELTELARYRSGKGRIMDALRRSLPPDEQARAVTGDEAEVFLAEVLAALDAASDAEVVDERVRVALAKLGELWVMARLQADIIAERTGTRRRVSRVARDNQLKSAASKVEEAEQILDAVEKKKAEARAAGRPTLSDKKALEGLLRDGLTNDDGDVIFPAGSPAPKNEVAALERRIGARRALKKIGD